MSVIIRSMAFAAFLLAGTAVFAQDNLVAKTQGGDQDSKDKFRFEVVKRLPVTSVKDQAHSSTCWAYSGLGFVEAEMLRMGKQPVDLAEMFVVYKVYQEKAQKYVRLHGNLTFAPGGEFHDVLHVIKRYGIVPQEVYLGLLPGELRNDHDEMDSLLAQYMKGVVGASRLRGDWQAGFDGILDRFLSEPPAEFTYQGKKYTPRTFADRVVGINPDDYMYFMSWMSEPYYTEAELLVPDNWAWAKCYNIPLDEMVAVVDNALENGYTVAWAADVSEKGFSTKLGVAVVPEGYDSLLTYTPKARLDSVVTLTLDGPKPEKNITEQMRQEAFDDYSTQDDHGMLIIGLAKDQTGKKYYIVKNSWGPDRGRDGGMVYVSEAYLRYKTISIVVNRGAVPQELLKKLK